MSEQAATPMDDGGEMAIVATQGAHVVASRTHVRPCLFLIFLQDTVVFQGIFTIYTSALTVRAPPTTWDEENFFVFLAL